jgi:predicted dithiol-disulfide oxidoreductase (DUF899 family)
MTRHKTGTREEYQAAREALLGREKELTHRSDELAEERRQLPWVELDKEYEFDTGEGRKTLAELFDGRSQLLVYHFMFGPHYDAGCPVCSAGADTFDGAVPHLNARDVTFTCVSRAPLENLQAYKQRMGWTFPWASSHGSDFNYDFHATHTEEELAPFLAGEMPPTVEQFAASCGTDTAHYVAEGPALTAFALDDGKVYVTYTTSARGLEPLLGFYPLLDRVSKGRDESSVEPLWIRRHDEY